MILRNIRTLCHEQGITIAELERNAGLGNGIIARWSKSSPRVDSLMRVASLLSVSLDEITKTEGRYAEHQNR